MGIRGDSENDVFKEINEIFSHLEKDYPVLKHQDFSHPLNDSDNFFSERHVMGCG